MADETPTTPTLPTEPTIKSYFEGDFTGEVRINGLWPKRSADEPDREAYSLTIRHAQYGELTVEPQCASNEAFCAARFVQFVNNWREEEAKRQTEGNGDGQ